MALKRLPPMLFLFLLVLAALASVHCEAQAALLMEEPYGVYGTLNPTGHNAIYLHNVCAETPVKLRRCHAGELGVVISRYEGVGGYDWVAIPLIPYLYAVKDPAEVPARVDHQMVTAMRNRYRERYLEPFGLDQADGSLMRDGWVQLIGGAYERRIYAFRFDTTPAQDDALIDRLNAARNQSHFQMLFRNCADFARVVLDIYFPHTFHRSLFPDAGVTTPKQIAYKLVRYGKKHPGIHLTVLEIPQIPGNGWHSHSTKDIAESFSTTAYAVPLTLLNPYLAGGIFVDYIVRGRYRILPKHPKQVKPGDLTCTLARNEGAADRRNAPSSAGDPPPGAPNGAAVPGAASLPAVTAAMGADSGLKERKAAHE